MISDQLLRLALTDRLPHGLLFVGTAGSDARATVTSLAKTLFCVAIQNGLPCDLCIACNKTGSAQHPDLRWVEPENREIKVEQVRDFQRWLSIYPHEASKKIGVIENADGLNPSAANALLKTLEEPPPHALIILLAQSANNILSTIRSRLMLVRFPAPLKDPFQNDPPPDWMDDLMALSARPYPVPPELIFELTESIGKNRDDLPWFFDYVERKLVEELKDSPNDRRIDRLFELTLRTERDVIGRYDNVSLALDHLLLEWLG